MTSTRTILITLLVFAGIFAAHGTDTNAVLDAWIGAQGKSQTWSADFIQTRSLKALSQPLMSTGKVWFAAPDRFRWELGSPAQTIAVRDAEQMLVIYPRLKRAERYPLTGSKSGPMGEALALLDAGFPQNRREFDARFRVTSLTPTNAAWLLDLQPTSPTARRMMPVIRVLLATNDFTLLGNELTFPDGSLMRSDFSHAKVNATFDENLFRPKLDEDFKITEPLGK